jgi:thiol-disulfide isomerase/thioredoxin
MIMRNGPVDGRSTARTSTHGATPHRDESARYQLARGSAATRSGHGARADSARLGDLAAAARHRQAGRAPRAAVAQLALATLRPRRSGARGLLLTCAAALLLVGCGDSKKGPLKASPGRSAAVKPKKKTGPVNDTGGFCEQSFPASGAGAVTFQWPPLRALPGAKAAAQPTPTPRWRWVNLWATWCKPCMEEMGLLARWNAALEKEGAGIALELLSIDAVEDEAKLGERLARGGLPGVVHWLRGQEDFGPLLDQLGVSRNAAIPIHALVDPKGQLRCVRVGAIGARDYAAVKSILSGG